MANGHKRKRRKDSGREKVKMKGTAMVETNDTCDYVENFIKDLLSGNLEIVYSRAKSLVHYFPEKGFMGSEKQKDKKPFPSVLGLTLTNYQQYKTDPLLRQHYAETCFQYILWANTHQVIRRTGMLNKINELKKENTQLKEENGKYQKEINRLNELNEALHKTMDTFGGRIESNGASEDEGNEE
jgi:FtsZ-binding cell division protein ZapB